MSDLRARLRIEGDASSAVAAGQQLGGELQKVRQEAGRTGEALGAAGRQSGELGRSSATAAGGVGRLDRELGQTAASSQRAAAGLDRAADRTNHLNRSASQARGAVALLGVGLAAVGGTAAAREFSDAAMAAAGLELGMGAVTGGVREGRIELAFAADEADRLGLVAQDASRSMVSLAAATNGTIMQGQATREIWLAVNEAGMALGRTNEQLGRGMEAITQIAGKGVVSMEEVRQQLAEAIPGAVQIGARAMNMTTAEFDKIVSKGDLLATEFLPKFAAQLRSEYGPAIENYLTTPMGVARVEMGRFETQIRSLQAEAGTEFLTGMSEGLARLNAELGDDAAAERARQLGRAMAEGVNMAADAAILLADNLDMVFLVAQAVAGVALSRWLITTATEARAAAGAYILKGQAARTAAADAAAGAAQETAALTTVRGAIIAAAQAEATAAAGQVTATEARMANVQAALAQARAEQANASSSLTRAQRLTAVTLAEAEATAATNAHTAALARQQAADVNLARSKTLLGQAAVGARGAMSGLLGLVGGPWGAAFLAAGAAVVWTTRALQEQEAKFKKVKDAVAASAASYQQAERAAKALGLQSAHVVSAQDQAIVSTASLTGEVDKLADANYRAAAAAKALVIEQLRVKTLGAKDTVAVALENFNTVRQGNRAQAYASMAGGGRAAAPGQVVDLYQAADRKTVASEQYQDLLDATAESERWTAALNEESKRGLANYLPDTTTASGGGTDKKDGKGRKSKDRAADVLADLKLEAQAYREHAVAAAQGEAALDAWRIADAGRQAVARSGLEPTSKAAETIRKEAEEVERLGLAADRIAAAASLERQAVRDAAAMERRAIAAAGGRQAMEALRVTEAGLDVLTRQRVQSLDELAPAERAAAEAAMRAAEAKERQAIATEKAEAAAGAIEDLDRRIAAETRRTAAIGQGVAAEVEYARAEYVRQAVEQAGLEITDEAAQAIIRKANALFALTAATEAAADADDFERQLRLARLSNRERDIAVRQETILRDLIAQQVGEYDEAVLAARARAQAVGEAWRADWAEAIGEVSDDMRQSFIESGDLAFDDMGEALKRQLRAAIYDAFLAKPINMVVNAVFGGAQNGLSGLLGGGGNGGGLLGSLPGGLGGLLGSAGAGYGLGQALGLGSGKGLVDAGLSLGGSALGGWAGGALGLTGALGGVMGPLGALAGMAIGSLFKDKKRPYARADIVAQGGQFVVADSEAADGGPKAETNQLGQAIAESLNAAAGLFGIDMAKIQGLYTTAGYVTGGNYKALGGEGWFGGDIRGAVDYYDQAGRDKKGNTLGSGVSFSQIDDPKKLAEEVVRETILRAIAAGASDLTDAEARLVRTAESLEAAIAVIEKSRGFALSIEDAILQFTDPAAWEKKKALDAIEASYQALKAEANELLSAGLISADVLGRLDELKKLQIEDALKKLAGSAEEAGGALARMQPGFREWLDRQMLGANAPLNPLEQRNEAFRQYEDVLARAIAGDGDALSNLTQYADRLLSADRLATSDASARALLFEEVMADVRALAEQSTTDPVAAAIAGLGVTLSTDPVVAAIEALPDALNLPVLNSGGGADLSIGLAQLGRQIEASQAEASRRSASAASASGQDISTGFRALQETLDRLLAEQRTQNAFTRAALARV